MAKSTPILRQKIRNLAFHQRTRKTAIWIVAAVATFAIFGAIALPFILVKIVPGQLSKKFHREVSIEQMRINPFAMSASVKGFLMKQRQSQAAAVSFGELYINLGLESLFRLAPVIEEIRLAEPYLNLVRNEDQTYNFQDLIDEFTAGPPAETKPPAESQLRFSLNNIQLIDGKIDFDDRPEKTKHSITAIRIGVPFISNLPSDIDIFVKPAFNAVVNDTAVEIKGETKPFNESLESMFYLHVNDIQLPKYLEYAPVKLNFTVPSGKISGTLTASFKTSKGQDSVLTILGNIALRELVVKDKDDGPLLSIPSFDASIDAIRLFAKKTSIRTLKAQGIEFHLQRHRDGAFNVAHLTESAPESPAEKPEPDGAARKTTDKPFTFEIGDLLLESAKLHYIDETTQKPYRTRLDNVRVAIKNLSNVPDQKATVEVGFDGDGKEHFEHNGTLQLTPLIVEGKLKIEGLRPGSLEPYYHDTLAAEISEGLLDISTRYSFQSKKQSFDLKFSELTAALRNLRLETPGKKPLLRLPLLAVKDTSVDIFNKRIIIGVLDGQQASGFIQRNSDGTLNLDHLVKKSQTSVNKDPSGGKAGPEWQIDAKQIALSRVKVDFVDQVPPSGAKVSIAELSLRSQRFTTAKNQPAKITVDAKINNGKLRMTGTAGISPVTAQLRIEGSDIDLKPFQPYLENKVNFILTGGHAGTTGDLAFDAGQTTPAKIAYNGTVTVRDFATVERSTAADLLKWKLLSLGGLKFALNPLQLRFNDIDLAGFYARIVLGADGKINLQKLTLDDSTEKPETPDGTSPTPAAPANGSASPSPISIGKINLRDGNINFSDFFVKPNYSANLTGVQGTIAELKPEAPADLALEAKLDNAAPVDIRGEINPLGEELFMDIRAKAREIELSSFSPYSGKYVGYGIEKGKLTFDVAYKLEHRKLDAQTQFILDQLTFGEKIDSPSAMSLPVKLAVALLKDRNGVIDVGLPISGSLNDPQFSIGGIIWRIISNIITKAVTAPFALLGSVFGGGGGAELSYIEFDYGRATLSPTAESKIKTLAAAMTDRPGLKLEITGKADPTNDSEGLKRVSLENKVRAQKFRELKRQGTAPKALDEVQVTPDEYERYLRAAYNDESFPKPRNVIGLAKSLAVPEMESLMLKYAKINDEDVRELATRRAQTVRDRLLAAQITADRLSIVATKPLAKEEQDKIKAKSSRVDFSLT